MARIQYKLNKMGEKLRSKRDIRKNLMKQSIVGGAFAQWAEFRLTCEALSTAVTNDNN